MPYSQLSLDGKRANQEFRVGGVCGEQSVRQRKISLKQKFTVYSAVDKSNNYSFSDLCDNTQSVYWDFLFLSHDVTITPPPLVKDPTKKV